MASPATAASLPSAHTHFDDQCPVCDHEIPPDRLEEVHGRYAVRMREQAAEATAQLREQYGKDRAQAEAKAKTDLEEALKRQREEGAAREKAIREEEERKRDALLAERLAQADATHKEREAASSARATQAEGRAKAANEASDALKLELEQVRHDGAETLEKERRAAAEREAAARAAGKTEAEQAADTRVKAAETAAATAIANANTKVAESTAAQQKLAEDWGAKVDEAVTARQTAEQQVQALTQSREADIAARVAEAREALGKQHTEDQLAKDKVHFDQTQKLLATVADLQRKLENQKSNELGEGAEIKLYDALKEAFPGDKIRRVEKGAPGADIVHEIVENNKVCGKIVYDSKNRNAWQNTFAVKLRADQIAEKADHAILSTNKFPKDARELHLHEGVIIACPARVVMLATMLRDHIVQTHALRLGNEAREAKTEKLYEFITSPQCQQLLETVETLVHKIEQVDADEVKAQRAVTLKRGSLLKDILKANGGFRYTLDSIIGGNGEAAP